jgi:hypothetical protein
MKGRTTMKSSMTFNIIAKKENDMWIAHCLELDIVATSDSLADLRKDMDDLIIAQIDYAFSNNNLDNLYRPAPPEIWKEFYSCKKFSKDKNRNKIRIPHQFFCPSVDHVKHLFYQRGKHCLKDH